MLKSMTGYGRCEITQNNRKFCVELKSVNHKYSDITVKLPRILNPYEDDIRKRIGAEISRGKVDAYVSFETMSDDDINILCNETILRAYIEKLRAISENYEIRNDISLSLVCRLPEIFSVDKNIDIDKSNELVVGLFAALDGAISQFVAMRMKEGEAQTADLTGILDNVKVLLSTMKTRAPLVAAAYGEKLRDRLAEYNLGNVDESRLLIEITMFADKACIDEELSRFASHIEQFENTLADGNRIGRKLDFIIQEMNRECNTIGSKSNDLEITKNVVELKSELEKIREQVQNIE